MPSYKIYKKMKQHRIFLFILLVFISSSAFPQPPLSPFALHSPLKTDFGLSGSFGEIRTNSFHAGIDFRTGGRIGLPVYASDNGFVSRIKVSSVGYGNAVYIQHENGLTTVYAHLHKFSNKIERLVKEQQYKERSFEVDFHLSPSQIEIKKGEQIGLSGNSGSSGGPHLHYEVRETKTQAPLNPSFSNLSITDKRNPVVKGVWLYGLHNTPSPNTINSRKEVNVQQSNNSYICLDTIYAESDFGLSIEAYDYVNNQSLRCGVYAIKMFVNDSLHYYFSIDKFRFSQTRYANSHIDYALRQETGKRAHKLFVEPNNQLDFYKALRSNGAIIMQPDSIYNILVEIFDSYDNKSTLAIVAKGLNQSANPPQKIIPAEQNNGILWPYFQQNELSINHFSIEMPPHALYSSIYFTYQIEENSEFEYSPVVSIHSPLTPVHKNYSLAINANNLPEKLKEKALAVFINDKNEIEAAGGSYSNGKVSTFVNFFGRFAIAVDTIPPTINLINAPSQNDFRQETSINFNIKDNLSGISNIEGLIDGKWALFEYDKKNDLVFYQFDKLRLEEGKQHTILLKVTDAKNNSSEFESWFIW